MKILSNRDPLASSKVASVENFDAGVGSVSMSLDHDFFSGSPPHHREWAIHRHPHSR